MKKQSELSSHGTRRKVREYLAATQAKNTQLAYRNDITHFLKSGGKIPAWAWVAGAVVVLAAIWLLR